MKQKADLQSEHSSWKSFIKNVKNNVPEDMDMEKREP
jgi:hypothetical protein